LENRPSSGGKVDPDQPAPGDFTPAEIPDGYIWVDQDGVLGGAPLSATAIFTQSAPTSSLTTGLIWVDKDPTSITANPFIPTAIIDAKGDLVVGSGVDTAIRLAAPTTNGYVLSSNSATTSGLEWKVAIDTEVVATTNNTLTMSGKTLTTPVINGATITGTFTSTATLNQGTYIQPVIQSPEEKWNIVASAATGTVNLDVNTAGVLYYTSNATGNWTLNVRASSSTSLNSVLATGDSITVVFFATNGATPYYQTAFQIDGSAITPKWQNATAPASGNANSIDIYSFTIAKTADATFTAFGSQTRFA
jgi:hypothetical protein